MKKISEKSFKLLKVCILCTVVIASGIFYILNVSPKINAKIIETSEQIYTVKETTKIIESNDSSEDFIIEIIPSDDTETTENIEEETKINNDIDLTEESLDSDLININTASEEELQTLQNIGPVAAKSIVDYRSEFGKFNNIEDLMNVKGIGKVKFSTIKDKIYAK